ncbi:adhesion G protein-coupled receptor L4-like [Dysidea avara]|uniref:adhesion G protein-coupled receptor L4-like n=1 Tax=Dysidea avara TaxID=196820 RepID=UPI00332ECB1B
MGKPDSNTIRAISSNIVVLEGEKVALRCIAHPNNVAFRWTFNGLDLPDGEESNYQLVGLNHSLTIKSAKVENSGEYRCHLLQREINATIMLQVNSVACLPSIAGGLIWIGQSAGKTSVHRCSDIHHGFRSGVTVSRRCNETGEWEDVDYSSCTTHLSSHSVIVTQAELMANSNSTQFETLVNNYIHILNYEVVDINTITLSTDNTLSVAIITSVMRSDENAQSDNNSEFSSFIAWLTNHHMTRDNSIEVIGFVPDFQCSCDRNIRPNSVKHVCIGPSAPPCVRTDDGYQCHQPVYTGDGVKCGLDSDSDGYPDVQLDCEDQYCMEDVCPTVYSLNSDGGQDDLLCSYVNVDPGTFHGCLSEVDDTWLIFWPHTTAGSVATQKCNGNDSIGLVTRDCNENGTWGRVMNIHNCYSIEISALYNSSKQLKDFYIGSNDTDMSDITQSPSLLDSLSISTQLAFLTNTTIAMVPNDLHRVNDILHTIISIQEYTEDTNASGIAKELSSTISNLLNDSNRGSYDYIHDGINKEAESLLENIDNFANVFRSLLVTSNQQPSVTLSAKNFDVSFELPSVDDFHSPSELKFKTENAEIYIPYASLRYQMEVEGALVPVANYAAQNLASFLPARTLNNTAVIELYGQLISSQISLEPISLPPDGYVRLMFKLKNPSSGQPRCVFWNASLQIDDDTGGWSEEGVFLDVENTNSTTITCVTKHLTSFAVLVDTTGAAQKTHRTHAQSLSIVSYIGCGVSIICLLATIIIILLFRKSAFKAEQNMIHMSLSLALLLGLVVFVSGIETAGDNKVACIVVTVLLHYFFLAAFCWMLCEGIIIYVLLAQVFYDGFFKRLRFYSMIGWGMPIPIVAITAGLSYHHYDDDKICWLPEKNGIIWGFIAPVISIIVCNTGILLLVIYTIFKISRKKIKNQQITKVDMGKKLIWGIVILQPILGFTWIVGLIAVNKHYLVFAWIFTVLNSFQGLFIFILYVLRNEEFREIIKQYIGYPAKWKTPSPIVKINSHSAKTISQTTLLASMESNGKRHPSHEPQDKSKLNVSQQENNSNIVSSYKSDTSIGEIEHQDISAV